MTQHICGIHDAAVPERLDKIVVRLLEQEGRTVSRTQVQDWIGQGLVQIDGVVRYKANYNVSSGSRVECIVPDPVSPLIEPDLIPLHILYEDESVLAIHKPAGLVVHPGAGIYRGTLANALVEYYARLHLVPPPRMGIVHRLDKETSGVLIIGKTEESALKLSRQFAERLTEKYYLALVSYTPRRPLADEGAIEKAIARHPTHRTKMCVREDGKGAITKWNVIERFSYGALLEVKIETGRTHQIRVHMEYLRAPIVGDATYGDIHGLPKTILLALEKYSRHALHAWKLTFTHPRTQEKVTLEAPMDDDFKSMVEIFRSHGKL